MGMIAFSCPENRFDRSRDEETFRQAILLEGVMVERLMHPLGALTPKREVGSDKTEGRWNANGIQQRKPGSTDSEDKNIRTF